MKQKCLTMVKVMTALVLAVLMMVGSVSNVVGAVVGTAGFDGGRTLIVSAEKGLEIAENANVSESADDVESDDVDKGTGAAPDLSGFEENEIVRGMKDDLADTGANTDLAQIGYSSAIFYLQNEDGTTAVTNSTITLDGSNRGTYTYNISSTYQGQWMRFYIEAGNDQFGIKETATNKNYVTNGSNFNLSKGPQGTGGYYGYYKVGANATSVTFTFQLNSNDGTIQVSETSSFTGWYLIGGNNNEWGAWNTSAKSTELLSNGTDEYSITVTVTGKTYFRVHDGGTEYNLGSSSDTAITNTYQNLVANNKKAMYLNSAGTYIITVKHNDSTKQIKAENIAMSTLTVADTANATVTATYNGLTASEGDANKLSNIPQDATITVNVVADQGYEIDSAVYYPDNNPTDTTDLSSSFVANRATFKMPAFNTTIEVTMRQMSGMRKVYFNNYKTKYSKVFAYAYDKSNGVITKTPLGPRPGTAMTKLDNSNTWVIEVPYGIQNIIFTGDDGYNTENAHEAIPWSNYPSGKSPMYYPASTNKTNPAGDWKEYVPRTNEYEVSAGSTLADNTLFSGINATFYDYLYDTEIDENWLTSITDDDAAGNVHDPYTILNKGLSDYAKNYTVNGVADDVTYPLYFGVLAADSTDDLVKNYHNFVREVNNASGLNNDHNALTGLTGQLQDGDGIHYYKSGATNENGAPMALFDEDFLSGENTAGSDGSSKVLATILRSHAFPVRKLTLGQGYTVKKIYMNPDKANTTSDWAQTSDGTFNFDAYFYGDGFEEWVAMTKVSGQSYYVATVPENATSVIFVRRPSDHTNRKTFSSINKQSVDISPALTGDNAKNMYTFDAWDESDTNKKSSFTASLSSSLDGCSSYNATGHKYYQYDSTNGKDNAFITNINTSNHTAQINYYKDSAQYANTQIIKASSRV